MKKVNSNIEEQIKEHSLILKEIEILKQSKERPMEYIKKSNGERVQEPMSDADLYIIIKMGRTFGYNFIESVKNFFFQHKALTMNTEAQLALTQKHPDLAGISITNETTEDQTMTDNTYINNILKDTKNYNIVCKVKRRANGECIEYIGIANLKNSLKKAKTLKIWAEYPQKMLRWKAVREAIRLGFADALMGLHTSEENQDYNSPNINYNPENNNKSIAIFDDLKKSLIESKNIEELKEKGELISLYKHNILEEQLKELQELYKELKDKLN